VLSYDEGANDGGPLTPLDRSAAGERADAPPARDGAQARWQIPQSSAGSLESESEQQTANPSRNGSEPIPVMRALDSREAPLRWQSIRSSRRDWLVSFLREEFERRGFEKAVIGLSAEWTRRSPHFCPPGAGC